MPANELKALVLSFLILISFPSLSNSFHPTLNEGGHDTFTTEGAKLKTEVHKADHDGGKGFNEFADQAIEGLRTGAHDEDSTKTKGYYIGSEKPIGPNGDGNFFNHFYNPDTGQGLKGNWGDTAPRRAVQYILEIARNSFCHPGGNSKLTNEDRKKMYDYFGRILHLIQDMGNPSHTKDDLHVFTNTFEDYVRDHWSEIVNSEYFRKAVTPEEYLKGNYGIDPAQLPVFYPDWFIEALAKISKDYYTDGLGKITDAQLQENVNRLIPETIKYTGAYINAIYDYLSSEEEWKKMGLCEDPPDPPNPAGDHPDDRFDVSDGFYWEREFGLSDVDLTKLYLRTSVKKGKIAVWYKDQFMQTFLEGRTNYMDAPQDVKDAIEARFQALGKKLEHAAKSDWTGSPDIALFTNGFYNPSISLMLKIGEPVRFLDLEFDPGNLKDHPVLLVPTGGFYGLKNSGSVKTMLEEYVKNGGTLVVLTQQHGVDWELLPTEVSLDTGERKPVTGYGYQEDQSCQYNSVYIDTYHPILSVFSTSTANIGVDGYFTSYPADSTVLLRRTANGQPAMIMYPYGQGYVIATTLYTDFALTHHQANETEISLVQNIISWAKKPDKLTEIKPGETVSATVSVSNYTDTNATSIKFSFLDPSRKVISEQTQSIAIPAGQSASIPVSYTSTLTSALGIYHIDYALLDGQGNVVQPQAETDSGRFVVSKPPTGKRPDKAIWFSISTSSQEVLMGAPFDYTFHIFNNTNEVRNLTITNYLRHTYRSHTWNVVANPNSETTISGADPFIDWYWRFETMQAVLYDESMKEIGRYELSFRGLIPTAEVSVQADKQFYARGQSVASKVSIRNMVAFDWQGDFKISVWDPGNRKIWEEVKTAVLAPHGEGLITANISLPADASVGTYSLRVETWGGSSLISSNSARFEVHESKISVTPTLPPVFISGDSSLLFSLTNVGKIGVNSGVLDIKLLDPEGGVVSSRGQPFTLAVGETKTLEVPISFPPLKFGNYTLTYSQSDETRTGSPALITIPNTSTIALSFDKPSYRIRETANLVVDLKNTGKFHQINMGVTANIPDMGFTQTEMVNLPQSQGQSVTFAIPISEGIGSGSHLVQVTVTLPAEESEIRTTYLEIPSADVKFSIGPSFYRTGDTVTVSCVNAGGVDSNGSISIKLYDFTSTKMLERQGEGVVSAGDSWDFSFDLPLDLVSGPYVVEGEFIDGRTGKVYSLRKSTSLEGVGASLSVEADKEIYLAPDIKNALARIIPVVPVPIQGNLHLKASLLKPWFAEGDFPEESVVDPNVVRNRRQLSSGEEISNNFVDLMVVWNGRFTIGTTGGDPENLEDDEAKLLYGHPSPWTSFSTVQIDGSNYRLGIDYYPYQSPVFDEENHSLITEWRLSSLRVLQRQSLVYSESTRPDVVQLDYLIRNEDTVPREVGLRIMLDTQLGENDGAPFYIPQFGNITQEREFGRDEVSAWLSLDDLSKPSVVGKGILKGLGATPPDRFVIASWDDIYDTAWDYAIDPEYSITDDSAVGIWWNPLVLGPGEERRITTFYGVGSVQLGQVVWERSIPVDLNRSGEPSVAMDIPEGLVGKFSLQGRLYSSSGQIISQSLDPFYIMPPQTILTLHTDKSYYRPGEEVRVAGEVKNLAGVGARNLNLTIRKQGTGEPVQQIYEESFDLGAGLGRGFSFTIPTPSEGVVALIGEVKQNESPLVEITDQYVVTLPKLSWEVTVPTVVSGETFTLNVNLYNEGHVTAAGHLSIVDEQGQVIGEGDVSIPAGESRLYQYGQQITSNKTYSFSLTGDLEGSETRSVYFGLAASLVLEAQRVYPEGRVGIPLTIRNTGSFDETLEIQFLLNLSSQQKTKEYFLPRYESITDTLYFDLPEGDYQITANSQVPSASAQASFYVRKENQAELAITFGPQTEGLLPVSVNLQNAGSNEISGNVSVSVSGGNQILWTSQQAFSNLSALGSQPLPFNINPSAFPPGDYVLQVEVFNNGGQLLGMRNTSFKVSGPVFQVTPVPASGTFYPGEEGTFTFKVKNVGNQEGAFDLHFKSYDLIDLTRREWLKAGEEKSMDFSFLLPLDLEEKDYFATYRLQSTAGGQASPGQEGQVKYRLAGINLRVSAALDKQLYQEGEMAHLTLSVSPTVPLPSALNLFARVNYPGFESNQPFALASSQILPFDVPLAKITGEKLFFGIYHESGRSLHLNSLYIHKAGDVLTITTDKQVYSPGETISVSVTGNVSGNLTLSAPNYEEAISFPGTATRSFILPSAMTAGTYYISYQLSAVSGQQYSGTHPFDVDGIQVKVKEASLDKVRYASPDVINLGLTVESNRDIPATLKTWVVDPDKGYTATGTRDLTLTLSAPLLVSYSMPFTTAKLGIHRIIYGLYSGDMLLVSGAQAFDMGEAVALGLATDLVDYPMGNEPVVAKASLFGNVPTTVDFFMDGQAVASQTVVLSGFTSVQSTLPAVKLAPGRHVLKAVLSYDGLTSSKETSFIYGSSLPDLAVRVYSDPNIIDGIMKLTIVATNQGKSASHATTLYLYDGPVGQGSLLTTLAVESLAPGGSQTFTYSFNCLGKAGANLVSALIDPDNQNYEFQKGNNQTQFNFTVPELALNTVVDQEIYFTGDTVLITGQITNLSNHPSAEITLTTEVKDGTGLLVFTNSKNLPPVPGMETTSVQTLWATDLNLAEGVYSISQALAGKEATRKSITLKPGKDFSIASETPNRKGEAGEAAQYVLTLTPLKGFEGEVNLSLQGCPSGFNLSFKPNPVILSGGSAFSTLTLVPSKTMQSGSYKMKVNASGLGKSHDVDLSLDLTDFLMTAAPATQVIKQLDGATYTLNLVPLHGFDSLVNLTINEVPKGMKVNLSVNPVTLPSEVILELATSKWLLPGTYDLTITARGRVVSHAAVARVIVDKNPALAPRIVTAPGPMNRPVIETFQTDGTLLTQFLVSESRGDTNIATGDIDGDGMDEIIAAVGWKIPKSHATLGIYRRDGTPVAVMETDHWSGMTVASADLDGDWVEEVAVGSFTFPGYWDDDFFEWLLEGRWDEIRERLQHHHSKASGLVRIYKVIGGKFVDTGVELEPYGKEGYWGAPNIAFGDVDGDGQPELITAPGPDPAAPARIKVFKIDTSGGVGQWRIASQIADLIVHFGEKKEGHDKKGKDKSEDDPHDGFGAHIAAGDVDGDGKAEIIVGAGPDPRKSGRVIILYNQNGTYRAETFDAFEESRMGVYVSNGDVDGDGVAEIIAGAGPDPRNKPVVRIFRRDGTLVDEFQAYPNNMRLGVKVSAGGVGEK